MGWCGGMGSQRCCLICVQVCGYSVGKGPNTRHHGAVFIRCTVEMYNHVLSAWLWACQLRSEG